MGYDLLWFACKLASCDPAIAYEAIAFEENRASLEILKHSNVTIQGMPILKLSSPQYTSEELLQQINIEELRKSVSALIPKGWVITHDSDRETIWETEGGAVQISWKKWYAFGTGYGKFSNGFEAIYDALTERGLTCFDPQVGKKLP